MSLLRRAATLQLSEKRRTPEFTALLRRGNLAAVTRLSIIIPVLDESTALAAQLPALQELRACGHELIVVDGESADDSVQQCEGRVDHLLHTAAGRALQMNAGAAVASGEILLFLHIDTELKPEAVRSMLDALKQTTRLWGRFDVRLSGRHPALRIIGFMMNWRSRLSGIATGDQAIFVRRATFWSAGGYAAVPLMEDVMLSRALKRQGRPVCLRVRVISSSRRWEKLGIVTTVWLMWRLRLAFFLGADPADLHRRYYSTAYGQSVPGQTAGAPLSDAQGGQDCPDISNNKGDHR